MASPADPTAQDRETARRIAGRCWYATSDDPHATCDTVGASDRCVQCAEADAIARALATARAEGEATGRAEEREACVKRVDDMAAKWREQQHTGSESVACVIAAAIRAREGADDGK